MSASNNLPRVWASKRRVYVEWAQFGGNGARVTAVINLGAHLDDVLAWPKAVPADAVELVPVSDGE